MKSLNLARSAMASFRLLSIFCSFVILISQTSAQQDYLRHFCRNDKGNYTARSTYETNLHTLLYTLFTNKEIDYGFYNFSYGQNSDKVNAIGLCRGDLKPDVCRSCLNESRILLTQKCPNQKEAIVYYDLCVLRYSNRSIFGISKDEPPFYKSDANNVTVVEVIQFNQALSNLMHNLANIASSGDSRLKFAARNASAGFQTIFGLVQCTPDLSCRDCENCLLGAISKIPSYCNKKLGGRVIGPSCNIRYEGILFYDTTTVALPPAPLPPSTIEIDSGSMQIDSEGKSNTWRIIMATVVPFIAIIVLLVFIYICSAGRKSKEKLEDEDDVDDVIKTTELLRFDFGTIEVATNNFSDANRLGKGGFGHVYKGRLTNGQEIAVKRLSKHSSQGDTEFKNEVLVLGKLQHRNLVRLVGFSFKGRERLLIYEYIQNKSLDYYIFDPINRLQLNWERRYKIIIGIARGLLYLHEEHFRLRIIHRDLKVSNILLDEEMNAKISDFGLARIVAVDQIQMNTQKIVGTYGYMAPEYLMYGHFSEKSDTFSFGVMILEIMSGHKNNEENKGPLLSFTWKHWRKGTIRNIIDPTLNLGSINEMLRCIHIGLLCVQKNIAQRPTMATIECLLNIHYLTLPTPSEPAYFMDSNSLEARPSGMRMKSIRDSINEASTSELYPR